MGNPILFYQQVNKISMARIQIMYVNEIIFENQDQNIKTGNK